MNEQQQAGDRRQWLTLAAILIGSFMALIDVTVVNVALPSIQTDLGATSSQLEWIVAAYSIAFGLALIPSGRLGDQYGRKIMFIGGLAMFTVFSVICGLVPNPNALIAARIGQGLFAGAFLPQISATIQALFEGHARSKAFGYLGSVVALSTALGPIIGGVVVEWINWRWVFFINAPIGVVALFAAAKLLTETKKPDAKANIDPFGLALLTVGLLAFEVPLTEGEQGGWPIWTFISMVLGIVVLVGFAAWELRQQRHDIIPVAPPKLVGERGFGGGALLGLIYFAGFSSIFFILSVFYQEGLHKSPLATGVAIVPFAVGGLISALLSARLTKRLHRHVMTLGTSCMVIGLIGVTLVVRHAGADLHTWQIAIPLFVAGLGNGFVIAPNQNLALSTVDSQYGGVAGALLQTTQRLGTAIGISLVGTVLYASLGSAKSGPKFAHAFATATLVNIGLVVVAFLAVFALPTYKDKQQAAGQ